MDTTEELMEIINEYLEIVDLTDYCLRFNGKLLEPNKSLDDQGITSSVEIILGVVTPQDEEIILEMITSQDEDDIPCEIFDCLCCCLLAFLDCPY